MIIELTNSSGQNIDFLLLEHPGYVISRLWRVVRWNFMGVGVDESEETVVKKICTHDLFVGAGMLGGWGVNLLFWSKRYDYT